MTDDIIRYEGKTYKLTKEEYDTFVSSISTQNPTEAEIKLHLWYCDSKQVHPLDKFIFFTKRKGRYVPVVSIDLMRVRAESSGSYAGSDDAVFVDDPKSKFPVSASITVWKMVQGKLGRFTATARWSEYAPEDLSANTAFMWKKMPRTMLAKCAEALALRKAFPGTLSGFYAREEMAQDGRYVESDAEFDFEQKSYDKEESPEQPQPEESPIVDAEIKVTAEDEAAKFTPAQLRKDKQIEYLQKATGRTVQEICAFTASLDKDSRYSLAEVENKIKESNKS